MHIPKELRWPRRSDRSADACERSSSDNTLSGKVIFDLLGAKCRALASEIGKLRSKGGRDYVPVDRPN